MKNKDRGENGTLPAAFKQKWMAAIVVAGSCYNYWDCF